MSVTGFFQKSEPVRRKIDEALVPRCPLCLLYKDCRSPKMPVSGEGRERILVAGEAPGKTEDEKGLPFVGYTGRFLQETFKEFGFDLFRDCWVTNSIRCHPEGDRTPTGREIEFCRPLLRRSIQELKPEKIILLGGSAVDSLLGWLWRDNPGKVSRWVGWQIPDLRLNAWICPTWHPSFALRSEKGKENAEGNPVAKLLFRKHLQNVFALKGKPWKEVPSYEKQVQVELDPVAAADRLDSFARGARPVAVDFETDRLKPDAQDSSFVSCAVSDGLATLSYPLVGKTVGATQRLLASDIPKIGYNCKFEERWSRRIFGCSIRNWIWDGMLAAHVLDNRPGICGLKFQAYVQLGQAPYDVHIKPYLESEGSNVPNRVRELPLEELLVYGGLDALLEWKVAERQMQQFGLERNFYEQD